MHWARTKTAAMATLTTIVSAVALTVAVGGTAHAQNTTAEPEAASRGGYRFPDKAFRVTAGAYLPGDSKAKKALGSNFPFFGLSVDVYRAQSFLPVSYQIYFDFFKRIRNTDDYGRFEATNFAVGIGARYDLDPKAVNPRFNPYAGIGVSISSARVKREQFLTDVSVPGNYSQTARRTTVGGKIYLGVEHVRTGFFGEVGYEFAPKPSVFGEKVGLSGTHINLGYHF